MSDKGGIIGFGDFLNESEGSIGSQIKKLQSTITDDEYIGADGLIYCKKCHSCKIWISPDKKFAVRCICPCKKKEIEKENARLERERIAAKNLELRKSSLLVGKYAKTTFADTFIDDASKSFVTAYNRLKKYVEVADEALANGYGVYIYGDCGVGKTHLSACVANALFDKGYSVLFTNVFNISKSIRATYRGKGSNSEENILFELESVDFLFIDDLGTERYTDKDGEDNWLQEKLYELFNSRLCLKKPTICTSNYSLVDLVEKRGLQPKIMDRIFALSSAVLQIKGDNYRQKLRIKQNIPF